MTSPHADGPETDKAAWAGADAETVDAAEVADEAAAAEAAAAGGDGALEGEIVDEASSGLQAQLDERTADLQRVSAEFANYRRRMDRERTAGIEAARAGLLSELLPVVDDLDRARDHGDLSDGPLKAFADKMVALLAGQGVEQFGEEGDPFDPNLHEAVQDESDGGEPVLGTVLRKGYRMGERTLRAAMVIVR
ncbi:nucleotide exchange factor GrpE [Dietzia aurantiaca]|uniref:nucleotide exchange factor GrpE n=1 Tax=Dietzia aurantiaca TaxID=983873 RepID=UPI001E5DE2F8|nr:nucleotide exchange factor GrpE [Dietzia aurantiaca]MCD2261540.1 nucleotide exchange factor GrpE [Dietzia aurantiaca]